MKKLFVLFVLLSVSKVFADSEFQVDAPNTVKTDTVNQDNSSANFHKTKEFLPGEEVVTTTGKKVKVWSTEGAVKVNKAPEPFRDREREKIHGNINLYEESLKQDDKNTPTKQNN